MSESVFDQIEGRDIQPFVEKLLDEARSSGKGSHTPHKMKGTSLLTSCPSGTHADKNPSWSIDVGDSSGRHNCFSCNYSGNLYTLIKDVRGLTDAGVFQAIREEFNIAVTKPKKEEREVEISNIDVDIFHKALMSTPGRSALESIKIAWGIDDISILEDLSIGWSEKYKRVMIPIYDKSNRVKNFRCYSFIEVPKMRSFKTGTGSNRLFPVSALKEDKIYIVEGEKDCIVARSKGLNAVTCTSGSKSWDDDWNVDFVGKDVVVCYDCDEAGIAGAEMLIERLHQIIGSMKVMLLPLEGAVDSKGKALNDLTDYFTKFGGTIDTFYDLEATFDTISHDDRRQLDMSGKGKKLHLSHITQSKYNQKKFEIDVKVIGKGESIFNAPKEIKILCRETSDQKKCETCPLHANDKQYSMKFSSKDPSILKFVETPEFKRYAEVRHRIGWPKACKTEIQEVEVQSVQEIVLSPSVASDKEFGCNAMNRVDRRAYYFGHDVNTNCNYKMTGYVTTSPVDGSAIPVITEAKEVNDSVDTFKLTNSQVNELKAFQPDDGSDEKDNASLHEKLDHIIFNMESSVTNMVGRRDVHLGFDLFIHSVIDFEISSKEPIERGWVDCIFIGDPRTGKSQISKMLASYYQCADVISGENTTKAGLLGGMVAIGKKMVLQWGKLATSDKRAVIIDECQGLNEEIIGSMSRVRSSGLVETTKAGCQESTFSRTRLLWIGNPREGGGLRRDGEPVLDLVDMFFSQEDVARLDFALFVGRDEVSPEDMEEGIKNFTDEPNPYTASMCYNLVMWGWSRKSEHIHFTDSAKTTMKKCATYLTSEYTDDIPLIQSANIKQKIAKLAVALAVRTFSTEDGENVIVQARHVAYVTKWLDRIYTSPTCRYRDFTTQARRQMELSDEGLLDTLMQKLKDAGQHKSFVLHMLDTRNKVYSQMDIGELAGCEHGRLNKTRGQVCDDLLKSNAFSKYHAKLKITEAFVRYLRKEDVGRKIVSSSSLMS